jgi:hypothetical protein
MLAVEVEPVSGVSGLLATSVARLLSLWIRGGLGMSRIFFF